MRLSRGKVADAVRAAGGRKAVAEMFACSIQAVAKWERNDRVPPARAPRLAKSAGLTLHDLNPECFPDDLS